MVRVRVGAMQPVVAEQRAEGRFMARLIDDLLEYSRLGRKALRFSTVSLAEVMRHLAQDFAPRLAEEGGRLEIAPDMRWSPDGRPVPN